jgi:hypothetical protein
MSSVAMGVRRVAMSSPEWRRAGSEACPRAKRTAPAAKSTTPSTAVPAAALGTEARAESLEAVMVFMSRGWKAAWHVAVGSIRRHGRRIDDGWILSSWLFASCVFTRLSIILCRSTWSITGSRLISRCIGCKKGMVVQIGDKLPERVLRWVEMI